MESENWDEERGRCGDEAETCSLTFRLPPSRWGPRGLSPHGGNPGHHFASDGRGRRGLRVRSR